MPCGHWGETPLNNELFENSKTAMIKGTVFAVKRFATHDGPGIRTTIFLKGCPLRCWWCHNPEGLACDPKVIFHAQKCVGCGACVAVCPQNALDATGGVIMCDPSLCRNCGACVDACCSGARELSGRPAEVDELISLIEKDLAFYDQSGGGVTFSGGEPLLQSEFLLSLLRECGRLEIHRAVDTCGFAHPEIFQQIAAQTDLFLFDLKLVDSNEHLKYTGVPNDRILTNLRWLSGSGIPVIIRIPLVPGINDHERSLEQMAAFLSGLPGRHKVCLLPYHGGARHKYSDHSVLFRLEKLEPPSRSAVSRILDGLDRAGINAQIGG